MKKIRKKAKKAASKGIHAFGIMLMVFQSVSVPLATGALFAPVAVIAEEANLESPASDSSSATKEENEDKKDEAKKAEKETPKTPKEEIKSEAPSDKTEMSVEPAGLTDENIKVESENVPTEAPKEETGNEKPADTGLILPPVGEDLITSEAAADEKPLAETPKKTEKIQEKACLPDGAKINSSSADDWTVDKEKGTAETKNPVKLGIKYQFPLDDKVSVTFTCLPTDPAKLSALKIEQIDAKKIDLPEGTQSALPYAYDITTKMSNGDFEYDLTLPKSEIKNTEVSYIDKNADEVISNEIKENDLKNIDGNNIKNEKNEVKISELDHFTVFIVATHTGTIGTFSDWNYTNCAQGNTVATGDYLIMTHNDSALMSPVMDFSDYDSPKSLNFKARTYGGAIASYNTITVSISTNGGSNWSVLGTRIPANNTMTAQSVFDLSGYNETQVKLKLETLYASGGIGVGIDDVSITGEEISDSDSDGIPDASDNCPLVANPEQEDYDQDGLGNVCDPDIDNDGILNALDPNNYDSHICGDSDADTCDDCVVGVDGTGPLSDNQPNNDGPDLDSDGLCNAGDPQTCGNGFMQAGEQCDDGNTQNGDGCSATCQTEIAPVCGNYALESGETCDDGNMVNGDGCSDTCQNETLPVCGDGTVNQASEQCDDGNTTLGDGCNGLCQTETVEICGNNLDDEDDGYADCDDLDCADDPICQEPVCGNGKVENGEQCDDSNTNDGDGCSASCQIEREGSISGKKFEDCNADGIFQEGCEFGMQGWTIFIDANGNSQFDAGEASTITNRHGGYSFSSLVAGTYRVCEIQRTGWIQTLPGDSQCYDIILNGEDLTGYDFGNFMLGGVQGRKYNDLDGNGFWFLEPFMNDWTIRLYDSNWQKEDEKITEGGILEKGKYSFDNLKYGTHYVCEAMPAGWQQTAPKNSWDAVDNMSGAADEGGKCYKIEIDCSGEIFTGKTFGNKISEGGMVTVIKYSDDNENGVRDDGEAVLPDWDINLDKLPEGPNATVKTDAGGQSIFGNLSAGEYKLYENIQTGWRQTNISCEFQREESVAAFFEGESAIDNDNDYPLTLNSGDSVFCEIGNHPSGAPRLTIEKFNDQWPNLQSPGAIVDYTITIRAFENNVRSVVVKDLMPNGFSFNSITSVVKNGTTNLSVPDPAYHSPGTWSLGDMADGDEITIKFKANVGGYQQAGTYKDNAWAEGDDDSGGRVLALSVVASGKPDPGNINTNFVGTKIALAGSGSSQRVALDEDTKTETKTRTRERIVGRVLGASTGLPATGSNTLWVILAITIFFSGSGLILLGRRKRNNSSPLFPGKIAVKILVLAILAASIIVLPGKSAFAVTNVLNVRLEQPSTPTGNGSLNIGFVVLDITGGRNIAVDCYKKGPSDATFSKFSTVSIQAGGNSGTCDAVFNTDGVYEIYAQASAGSDSATSQIEPVTVDLNSQAPGTPLNYDRDGDSCNITFTTANDGLTSKVELYRSKDNEFAADASTFSSSVNILPNTSGSMTDPLGSCDDYLYAIRAVSASGVGSGFVGDEDVHVKTETNTRTRTITRTTIASQSGAIPTEGGTIAGEQTGTKNQEGEVAGEKADGGEINGEAIQGEDTGGASLMSKAKNNWPWIVGGILVLGYIYYAARKRKKSRRLPKFPDESGPSGDPMV